MRFDGEGDSCVMKPNSSMQLEALRTAVNAERSVLRETP